MKEIQKTKKNKREKGENIPRCLDMKGLSSRLLRTAIQPPNELEFLGVAPTLGQREEISHEARAVRLRTARREVQPIRAYPRVCVCVRLYALVVASATSQGVGTASTGRKGVVIIIASVVVGRRAVRVVLSHALLSASLFAQLRGRNGVRVVFTLRGRGTGGTRRGDY